MPMSHTLTLHCGCIVYVSCHPKTRIAHTRVIQTRGMTCAVRKHDVGVRLFLWEILPDRMQRTKAESSDPAAGRSTCDSRRATCD
jgi:hypothetical protein